MSESLAMPSIYLPHGGGPWPWAPAFTPALASEYALLQQYIESIPAALPRRPTGIVIVSAHWEAAVPTVLVSERPTMLYDYSGFPQNTYELSWPAPGSPQLARRVRRLIEGVDISTAEESDRGFDHGVFVPLKLAFPRADIPTVQLSLDAGYDPQKHLTIGRALAPLRDEGILVLGSGMSWEDFRARDLVRRSNAFDAWFKETATAEPSNRNLALRDWTRAPYARVAHPHEEHLLPMMVAAGAAGEDQGHIAFDGSLMGIRLSAVHFTSHASTTHSQRAI
ncbi:MAG: class III extradiol ring-cleavage dioxygenase [Sandaracinaceae bacterium]